MKWIMNIIDFILGLFIKEPKKVGSLKKKKEVLEKEIKEIDDEKSDTDSNIDYINNK